jgi:hypothetical protein
MLGDASIARDFGHRIPLRSGLSSQAARIARHYD